MRRSKVIPVLRKAACLILLAFLPLLWPADNVSVEDWSRPNPADDEESWVVIDHLPEGGFFLQAEDFEVRGFVLRSVAPAAEAAWAQKCLIYATPLPLLRRRIQEKLDGASLFAADCSPPDTRFNWREGRSLDGKEVVVLLRGQKLYVHVNDAVGTVPVEVWGKLRVSFRHGKGTLFPSAAANPWTPPGLPPARSAKSSPWRRR